MNAKFLQSCFLAALLLIACQAAKAQDPSLTESGKKACVIPKDGIYNSSFGSRQPLQHHHIEERDVLWEKKVWREIDVKELRNHHFAYAKRYFVSILLEAAMKGDIAAYSPLNDEFTEELSIDRIKSSLSTTDTSMIYNFDTEQYEPVIVQNELDPANVKRFRIKEVWYFDSRLGRLNVRILGIAPIVNRYDDNGNFIASMPMCWFYYDELRPLLAKEPAFNSNNDHTAMSWDDIFESRFFASYITKQSNTRDLRLQDIYSGVDVLRESDNIQSSIFNFEHDLFSY